MHGNDAAVKQTVINMINEIGQLRKLVAIDSMPYKLQQARLLLRELYAEYEQRENITEYYNDRNNSGQAALTAHK